MEARIERLAEEILEGPGNGSRNEAEDQPSSCAIGGDKQSCQTSNGRWSSTQRHQLFRCCIPKHFTKYRLALLLELQHEPGLSWNSK